MIVRSTPFILYWLTITTTFFKTTTTSQHMIGNLTSNLSESSSQYKSLLNDNRIIVREESRIKRRSKSLNVLPEFSAPIGNVTAVLGRDVRLVCTVEHLGSYQVSYLIQISSI